MRLFVGIPLTDPARRELTRVVARMRSGGSAGRNGGLRWTAPESWHITLQFLGNATTEQLECLKLRLGEVRAAPAPVEFGELGCFDRAGVFFVEVTVTPELAELQKRVVWATSRCGFAAEERAFHPHITLARAKGHGRGTGMRELMANIPSQPAFTRFTAREFVLYESHTEREGARYEAKRRFELTENSGR